ncbi:hypothetical protein MCOR25_009712 [Pyricularia grisea]|nr:hypothetical protein MCOR25_009712 [Pyricularia grisea]
MGRLSTTSHHLASVAMSRALLQQRDKGGTNTVVGGRHPDLDAPGSRFGGTALHAAAIRATWPTWDGPTSTRPHPCTAPRPRATPRSSGYCRPQVRWSRERATRRRGRRRSNGSVEPA